MEDVTAVPEASLATVLELLRHNLEHGGKLEVEISRVGLRLPTLYPENKPGKHYYTDSEDYYFTFSKLFRRLATFDSAAARREFRHWDSPVSLFRGTPHNVNMK